MTSGGVEEPVFVSALRPLRDLLEAMDADIARLYAARGVAGVRPRFSLALIRLAHRGSMTISELAGEVLVTHSAMSQTVTAMRREGLVDTAVGPDARSRLVSLTGRGRDLVPFLEAEWRATEAALAELQAEVPYPLTQVVSDLAAALTRRSFLERIESQLLAADAGQSRP